MHLRPVQQNDLPAWAYQLGLLMLNDEIAPYTAPRKDLYPENFYERALRSTKRLWYGGNFLLLCVSDPNDADWTGEEVVLGFCAYSTNVPSAQKPKPGGWLGNRFECWAMDLTQQYVNLFGLDRSLDVTANRHFRGLLADDAIFTEYFRSNGVKEHCREAPSADGMPLHWEVQVLGTHPDFRRRGVGRMMLEWGFDRARERNTPLILRSTTPGKKLYFSAGFREVGTFKLRHNQLGGNKAEQQARERLESLDLGFGVGKGLDVSAMAWKPWT